MLGHDGPPASYWRENLITGAPLEECPLRTLLRAHETTPAVANELDRYLTVYHPAYQDGHLLESGGIADQPARYLDFILAIRSTEAAVQQRFDDVTTDEPGETE